MLRMKDQRKVIGNSFGNPMSWRFLPEDDSVKDVIKDGDKDFDKERQAEDQRKANEQKYHKAQADAEAAQTRAAEAEQQRDQLAQENETNKQELANLRTKAAEQGVEVPELDETVYSGDDVPLVRAIKAQNKLIKQQGEQIKELDKAKAKMESDAQAQVAQNQRSAIFNELLTDLDGEYGAQHRNEVVKEWDQLVKEGKVPQGNPAKATRMMEGLYKKADKAAKKKAADDKAAGINLDSGSGGGGPDVNLRKVPLKSGSLEQVFDQVVAAGKQ